MSFFVERCLEDEILDDPKTPAEELEFSLHFMTRINRWFGGRRVIVDFLERFKGLKEFSLLDLGTGAGDIPHAVALWARRNGIRASITALDINPVCLAFARKHHALPEISHVRHSAFEIQKLGRFDFVTSSMFFHHLRDEQIVDLLKKMNAVATRGFIVNDLYRDPLAYLGAGFLALFSLRHIVLNDATLSVKKAFREADCERFKCLAEIPGLRIERKPVFRITMSVKRT